MDKLTEVVWPVVIDNRGDLIAFRSLADADDEIEIIDVDNGEFVAYDALGRLLALGSEKGRLTVTLDESSPTQPAGIRQKLTKFLRHFNVPLEIESDMSLSDLIESRLELEKRWESRW